MIWGICSQTVMFWHSTLGVWVVWLGDLGFGIQYWGLGLYSLENWVSAFNTGGLGCTVWGPGFWHSTLGIWFYGLGTWVVEFNTGGLGSMVWGPGFWNLTLGVWVVQFGDLGFGIQHWGFG